MMEELVPFGSTIYLVLLGALIFARGMDFLSTWVATPKLVLEANPLARKMGWKIGLPFNLVMCFLIATWPLPAVVIVTTSVLVAARNFQNAWLMRSMGEFEYRLWMGDRLREAGSLYHYCLFAHTALYALCGLSLMYFSAVEEDWTLIPFGMGLGIITYALAVLIYSLLSVSRISRKVS